MNKPSWLPCRVLERTSLIGFQQNWLLPKHPSDGVNFEIPALKLANVASLSYRGAWLMHCCPKVPGRQQSLSTVQAILPREVGGF